MEVFSVHTILFRVCEKEHSYHRRERVKIRPSSKCKLLCYVQKKKWLKCETCSTAKVERIIFQLVRHFTLKVITFVLIDDKFS
jgi:hypothetical protein